MNILQVYKKQQLVINIQVHMSNQQTRISGTTYYYNFYYNSDKKSNMNLWTYIAMFICYNSLASWKILSSVVTLILHAQERDIHNIYMYETGIYILLTLGAHGYSSCFVILSVCLSVCIFCGYEQQDGQ